jgi:branched-chain amino acid transport system ATP-binding protein
MSDAPVLRLDNINKSFGALWVSRNVSLSLAPGARQALIGPNGAGKTTLAHLISGVVRPTSGHIFLGSQDITRVSVERRVGLGLVRTFQISSLFPKLTVAENVALGVSARLKRDWKFWGEVRNQQDILLDYGQRRLVEVALALALNPKILVLDEPAAGLSSAEREVLFNVLIELPKDLAVLIIEHDMSLVFRLANKITVLVEGAVLTEGTVEEVRNSAQVREVYLGTRAHG